MKDDLDQVIWKLEKRGEFTIVSYYRFLNSGDDGGILGFLMK